MIKSTIYFLSFFLLSFNGLSQKTYYGYKSSSTNNKGSDKLSCEDALKAVKERGRYLSYSSCYKSASISKVTWYEYEKMLFCLVKFNVLNDMNKQYQKTYLYGGWKYNFSSYYEFKKEFEEAESKGGFFWKNIEDTKIDCR